MTFALVVITLASGPGWLADFSTRDACTEAAAALAKPVAMNVHSDAIPFYASCVPTEPQSVAKD